MPPSEIKFLEALCSREFACMDTGRLAVQRPGKILLTMQGKYCLGQRVSTMALMIEIGAAEKEWVPEEDRLGASGKGNAPGVEFATRKMNKRGLAFNE